MYEAKKQKDNHTKKTAETSRPQAFSRPKGTICLPLAQKIQIPDSKTSSAIPIQRYYDTEFVMDELEKIKDSEQNAAAISALLDNLNQYGYLAPRHFELQDVPDDTSKLQLTYQGATRTVTRETLFNSALGKFEENIPNPEDSNKTELDTMNAAIKFGTEFTFQHTKNPFRFSPKDLSSKIPLVSVRAAGTSIDEWKAKISQLQTGPKMGIRVNSITVSDGAKKWRDSVNYTAKKVQFCFYCGTGLGTVDWTLNIDLDPNCIETQTTPTTPAVYKAIQQYIQFAVFDTAESVSLKPDPNPDTGGGGHISIDTADAFQGNAVYLRNFLVLYANMAKNRTEDWVRKCTDRDNAPFLFDLGNAVEESFKEVIRDFDSQATPTMAWLVDEIQTKVYGENLTEVLNAIHVPKSDAPHYQAVNLENLMSGGGQGRIEMRRFDAQASMEILMKDLTNLIALLQKSRQTRKIPIDFGT